MIIAHKYKTQEFNVQKSVVNFRNQFIKYFYEYKHIFFIQIEIAIIEWINKHSFCTAKYLLLLVCCYMVQWVGVKYKTNEICSNASWKVWKWVKTVFFSILCILFGQH